MGFMLQTNLFKTSKLKHNSKFNSLHIKHLNFTCFVATLYFQYIAVYYIAIYTWQISGRPLALSLSTTSVLRITWFAFNNFNSSLATSCNINSYKQSSVVWTQFKLDTKSKTCSNVQQSQYDPWIQQSWILIQLPPSARTKVCTSFAPLAWMHTLESIGWQECTVQQYSVATQTLNSNLHYSQDSVCSMELT